MSEKVEFKPLMRVIAGERQTVPPIWLMRQAGRYLPEYRAVRAQAAGFLDLCYNPKRAAEVTLQPIRRFGFDAAILFSDILVVPDALGQQVSFVEGEGPKLTPLADPVALKTLRPGIDHERLGPVYETIALVKRELLPAVTLLGFCGAPWTLATYMVAGMSTPDQMPARMFAYRYPDAFGGLMDILVEACASYLVEQFKAGVDAVQIFDSWAGVLPPGEFRKWCIEPSRRLVSVVRERVPNAKIIGFPRGAGTELENFINTVGVDVVGLDWTVGPAYVRDRIQSRLPIQGNLDPLALLVGGIALDQAIDDILREFGGGPFIFNLGHGVLPATPIKHVERLITRIRGR